MSADDDTICTLWVIYDHPRDFPEWFVVRRWFVKRAPRESVPDRYAILAATLCEARAAVPEYACCIGRHPADDACVVEAWEVWPSCAR